MKITDRLKVEHGVFLVQLRHLEQMVAECVPAAVLAGVIETIAAAEVHHSALEDRLLYPALAGKLGSDYPALRIIAADHQRIQQILARIGAGEADAPTILELVSTLRDHMEREIHEVFVLAEEVLPEPDLHSMCNWDVEHIYEESGNEALWMARQLAFPKSDPQS